MKRIIICADGTWNHRDQVAGQRGKRHPSNVTKVARGILSRDGRGVDQVVFYHDGVGTSKGLDRFTGGAFGEGMEANIRELYRFIVYNHEPNDQLFFFGFSRGAFTVRTLAGFMAKVGLVEKSADYYVPDLYHAYEKGLKDGDPAWDALRRKTRATPCPPIRFIGVWDTVGALGAPGFLGQIFNRKKYQYHDVGLNPAIENAFHALAIDERRKPFIATLWQKPPEWNGVLQQAWFPGVHSNVGGGYEYDGLANEALRWLVAKAEDLGLACDTPYLDHFKACFNSDLVNSMTVAYRLFGNGTRRIGTHPADGEVIHQAALDRRGHPPSKYAPANLVGCAPVGGVPTLPVVNTARVVRGSPCPGPNPG